MMTALATVTKVVPAQQGFQVTLSCEQQTSCSSCQSSKSCGTGIVSKAFGNKTLFWRLQTTQALEAGEVVEIGLPEKSVLQSAALVYLLPLFFMMLGAWLGDQWLAPMLGFERDSDPHCTALYCARCMGCQTLCESAGATLSAASGFVTKTGYPGCLNYDANPNEIG